jgi:hypothetical protein
MLHKMVVVATSALGLFVALSVAQSVLFFMH